ncbi:D-alanyl-D-alanine carboxypeptidase [Kitasatospora sp. NPDC093806]|uniref:D-alanyl-D-alanine carboxypeptidase family protein n=1 Tax=Kitasatospora sp. NPDC093806 TaxID=3155075 RepID=UPI00344940CD
MVLAAGAPAALAASPSPAPKAPATAPSQGQGAGAGTPSPQPTTAAGAAQDAAAVVGGERLGRTAVQVAPRSGAPELPAGLTGRSWLIADAATGEVLAARNPHLPLPPASTLKMLFADTVLPKFDRSAEHRVTLAELAELGPGSSLVGIKENLPYRVEDLWRGVFLASGNDAVHVLAHMNGGLARTVTQMQERAVALQARDTRVVSPDGYDQDGQVSSAYDLTLFARAGLRNADFRAYCSTRTARFPGGVDKTTGQRTAFDIANTDRLLGKYPGLIGVKNGYTTNAGATFTGAAERGGRTLLVTVMHPEQQSKVYDEAAALLDWGFAAAGKVEPVGRLVEDTAAGSGTGAGAGPGAADTSVTAGPAGSAEDPAADVLPQAIRQTDDPFGPAGWTAVALGGALALWAAGRVRARRRPQARTAEAAPVPAEFGTARFTTAPSPAPLRSPIPPIPPLPPFPPTVRAAVRSGSSALGGATAVGGRGRRRLARRARAFARTTVRSAGTRLASARARRPH